MIDSLVLTKKSELDNYHKEMDQVRAELGKLDDSFSNKVSTSLQSSPILLGILTISLLLNLLAISQLPNLNLPFLQRR